MYDPIDTKEYWYKEKIAVDEASINDNWRVYVEYDDCGITKAAMIPLTALWLVLDASLIEDC